MKMIRLRPHSARLSLSVLESRDLWSVGAIDDSIVIQRIPNDESYGDLYGMPKIKAPQAWDISTGSRSVVIADIDSGVDYEHPDLYMNVWINQDEIPADIRSVLTDSDEDQLITFRDLNDSNNIGPGKITDLNSNGFIDGGDLIVAKELGGWADGNLTDDGNGYTDDLIGWNFVNNSNDPFDDNGHGTHTAGTIGAMGNNSAGVVGVNWQVQIMPLKFIGGNGSGSLNWAAAAIKYAVDNGAPVSNNSWVYSGGTTNDVVYQAVDYARTHNHLVIAASGNENANNDKSLWRRYPASFNLSNIISVAATDSRDAKANFSNYGSTSVDLGAPGVNILSTVPGGGYGYGSGTSMAAPHVTGAVGLILAKRPDLASDPDTIKSAILNTVDKVKALSGKVLTGGRLNVSAALNAAQNASGASSGSFTSEPDQPGHGSGNPGRASITGLEARGDETFTVTSAIKISDWYCLCEIDSDDESTTDNEREQNVQPVWTSDEVASQPSFDEPFVISIEGLADQLSESTTGWDLAEVEMFE